MTRKEKKKIKSIEKKQRKQNDILQRRATRNNEKYNKNQDRNRKRELELERHKIRMGAIHQVEKLAALYDPSGNLFNVGEVVTLPDGRVKSKETLVRTEKEKIRRQIETAERSKEKELNESIKLARKKLHKLTEHGVAVPPELRALAEKTPDSTQRLSRKQQQRQELEQPKPALIKPIIPKGYSYPECDENLLELWDITDEEILARIDQAKSKKKSEAKKLRQTQKEAQKVNMALKQRKKYCANAGVQWDPAMAKEEILGRYEAEETINKKNLKSALHTTECLTDTKEAMPIIYPLNKTHSDLSPPTIDMDLFRKAEENEMLRLEKKRAAKAKRKLDLKAATAMEKKAAKETRRVDKKRKKPEVSKQLDNSHENSIKKIKCEEAEVKEIEEGDSEKAKHDDLKSNQGQTYPNVTSVSQDLKRIKSKTEEEILDLMRELAGNIG